MMAGIILLIRLQMQPTDAQIILPVSCSKLRRGPQGCSGEDGSQLRSNDLGGVLPHIAPPGCDSWLRLSQIPTAL